MNPRILPGLGSVCSHALHFTQLRNRPSKWRKWRKAKWNDYMQSCNHFKNRFCHQRPTDNCMYVTVIGFPKCTNLFVALFLRLEATKMNVRAYAVSV
uniref:Uncharacterized protein n=1 Tax=Anopheles minimus TaxID=112268 RepID=A0A182WQC8_9DIPT